MGRNLVETLLGAIVLVVAGLFTLAMLVLIAALLCFLREIYVAVNKERAPRGGGHP